MASITVGTTPTITYTFSIVQPSNFTEAIMTIKSGDEIIIEKELEDATLGVNTVSWKLTQAETLQLYNVSASMMLNWKTTDGTRGASEETMIMGVNNHIREVI